MRLGRLVAAGLVLGAAAGFVAALLRPRRLHAYGVAEPDVEPPHGGPRLSGIAPPAAPSQVDLTTPDVNVDLAHQHAEATD